MRTGVERVTRPRSLVTYVIGLGALALSSACSFRVETFAIPAGTEHGWVTIEEGNSTCPAAWAEGMFVTVDVPRSRVLCTSNPTYRGWSYDRYFVLEPDGSRSRLGIGQLIHQRSTFTHEGVGKDCTLTGSQFFFGTREELTTSNAIFQDQDYLRQHHPGCL